MTTQKMDQKTNPKISIVTITRNRADFIAKALESAQKQAFTDWELLVLDAESNDNTKAIVEAFIAKDTRIKYFNVSATLGISKSRNIGLSNATGKYIAVLDSDDEWLDKDKLQKQFDFLENNPDYVLIGSNIKIVDEKGNHIKDSKFETEDVNIRKKMLGINQIPHSSVMYKKESAEKVGGYDEKLPVVEDLDFFLKLGTLGKFKNLKEIATSYTKHSGGISHQRKLSMAWNHFKIIFKNFGKYPNWFWAITGAKLRIIKNLF